VSYTSSIPAKGNGFPQLLRAEWTKLRSIRSTWICAVLAFGLTSLMAVLAASGSSTNANEIGPQRIFAVHLVHQPLSGDGSIVARLAEQEETGPDAKAGLMVTGPLEGRDVDGLPLSKIGGGGPDASYAAVMVTPGRGILWQADFSSEETGSTGAAPRWLKLTRDGSTVTGYESADGETWGQVGSIDLPNLPGTAEVGLFSTSPPTGMKAVRRSAGSTEAGPDYTLSTAVFDSVSLTSADGEPVAGAWQSLDTAGPQRELPDDLVSGSYTEVGGRITIAGAGDLGMWNPADGDNDLVRESLFGILIGFIAMAVVAALFITAEFRRGMIRTTFTASPHRGRVLAAKAVVVSGLAFVTGVVAATAAVLLSQPILRDNGFAPPAYPELSLTDGPVARAVVGSGLVLALLAVFALALGAMLRRSAAAITLVIALVILPSMIGPFLTLNGEAWLNRVTPMAGLAIQHTRERFDDAIGPWPGLAVLCAWVACAFAAALVLIRRRDA
jgi:hypothetical protein